MKNQVSRISVYYKIFVNTTYKKIKTFTLLYNFITMQRYKCMLYMWILYIHSSKITEAIKKYYKTTQIMPQQMKIVPFFGKA